MNFKDLLINNRFQILDFLGKGSFGEVWTTKDNRTDNECAIKIVSFTKTYFE